MRGRIAPFLLRPWKLPIVYNDTIVHASRYDYPHHQRRKRIKHQSTWTLLHAIHTIEVFQVSIEDNYALNAHLSSVCGILGRTVSSGGFRAGTKAGRRACSGNRRSRFACRRMGLPLHWRGGTVVWPAQETTVQNYRKARHGQRFYVKTFCCYYSFPLCEGSHNALNAN